MATLALSTWTWSLAFCRLEYTLAPPTCFSPAAARPTATRSARVWVQRRRRSVSVGLVLVALLACFSRTGRRRRSSFLVLTTRSASLAMTVTVFLHQLSPTILPPSRTPRPLATWLIRSERTLPRLIPSSLRLDLPLRSPSTSRSFPSLVRFHFLDRWR